MMRRDDPVYGGIEGSWQSSQSEGVSMTMKHVGLLRQSLIGVAILGCVTIWSTAAGQGMHRFAIGERDFLLDGERLQIRCGEIHFARVAREYWGHRLRLCKAMGLNTVCAYLFWNFHEWDQGRFDWSGQADAVGPRTTACTSEHPRPNPSRSRGFASPLLVGAFGQLRGYSAGSMAVVAGVWR
jgi:hypothetical protein